MNTDKIIMNYLQFRSFMINWVNSIKDRFRSVTEILGKEDNSSTASIYFKYIIVKMLVSMREYISNIIQRIDSKRYKYIQITSINDGVLIYNNSTVEDVILGNLESNKVDKKINNKVYIKYSLDDKICLKHIIRKYGGSIDIKVILDLNNVYYDDTSSIHMKYMDSGKIVNRVQKIE